jgi:hypothetical protein
MSDYKDELNKYKAKRTGIVDAKVVAPKGKKKKVDKPWCVVTVWGSFPQWGPSRAHFEKEHDARAYLRKQRLFKTTTASLFFNGEEVQ